MRVSFWAIKHQGVFSFDWKIRKITQVLNELKENKLKELEDQGIERLKELLDLNVSTIQEFYDFKLVVIYFEKIQF